MQQFQSQPGLTLAEIRKFSPCVDRMMILEPLLKHFGDRKISAAQAVEAGVTFDDLMWVVSTVIQYNKDMKRRAYLWKADCAARVLYIYERYIHDDSCMRTAIKATRSYARGEIDNDARIIINDIAREAARDATRAGPFSVPIAARAAIWASAENAIWDAARSAVTAAAEEAGNAAAGQDEEKWQFDRLVARLSNPEPADWPLDKNKSGLRGQ